MQLKANEESLAALGQTLGVSLWHGTCSHGARPKPLSTVLLSKSHDRKKASSPVLGDKGSEESQPRGMLRERPARDGPSPSVHIPQVPWMAQC